MKKVFILFVFGSMLLQCSEPFEFETTGQPIIVVDAKVSNVAGNSFVRIYQTQDGVNESIADLEVRVLSGTGAIYNFTYKERDGLYIPENASFEVSIEEMYKLEALEGGRLLFTSSYDSVPEPESFNIDVYDTTALLATDANLLASRDAVAVDVLANTGSGYAKFDYGYTYEHYWTGETITIFNENDYALLDYGLISTEDQVRIPIGEELKREWVFYNPEVDPILDPFAECMPDWCFFAEFWIVEFQVRQEWLSKSAFDYWSEIRLLTDNDGLLFDTFPFPLQSNVQCDACGFEVVGLFRTVVENYKTDLAFL